MEHTPVIHVIIPVYKAEKYISQTLDSVLGQPYSNIEIVCVDDGSPDDSISILKSYEKQYENIRVIRQENAGVSAARNKGIEYVLGQGDDGYLTFLDADDLWARNATSTFRDDLKGYPDCIGYCEVRCSENLTRMAPPERQEAHVFPGGSRNVWCHSSVTFGAVLYSCKLLREYPVRFVEGLNYAEDSIFKLSCFYLAESIKLVDSVLYCYRINLTSAMHSRKYGTDYMPAIIRGYQATLRFLRPFENSTRGPAQFASILSGIHAIEMVEEHFQKFRSARSLEQFLADNPDITETIRMLNRHDLSEKHQRIYDLYMGSTLKFRIYCYISGFRKLLMDILKKQKLVMRVQQKRMFPMSNEYL